MRQIAIPMETLKTKAFFDKWDALIEAGLRFFYFRQEVSYTYSFCTLEIANINDKFVFGDIVIVPLKKVNILGNIVATENVSVCYKLECLHSKSQTKEIVYFILNNYDKIHSCRINNWTYGGSFLEVYMQKYRKPRFISTKNVYNTIIQPKKIYTETKHDWVRLIDIKVDLSEDILGEISFAKDIISSYVDSFRLQCNFDRLQNYKMKNKK